MLFAFFLPLVILGLFTTDAAGILAFAPFTGFVAWIGLTFFAIFWVVPTHLESLISHDKFDELILAQDRLPWMISFWVLLLQAIASPAILVAPGFVRLFPQFAPLIASSVAYVIILWGCAGGFHRGFRAMLLWEQTPAEYLRARLSAPILLFPPLLAGAFLEDIASWISILPGLSDLPLIVCSPIFCICLYLFSPNLFNWAWQAEPLKEKTAMAAEIMEMTKKTGTPIAGIRVWNTFKEPIPNAAVVGLIPSFRYVYLTRHLLDTFPEREQIVIVAHELGHFRLGHVWTYLWFTFLLVFLSLSGRLLVFLHWPRLPELLSGWYLFPIELFGFLGGFILLFTALSRASEYQADCFAADLVGKSEMISAMNHLSRELRPPSRRFPWWMETHPDFSSRIARIESWNSKQADLILVSWRLRLVMCLLIGFGLAFLLPTFGLVWDLASTARYISRNPDSEIEKRLGILCTQLGDHPVLNELAARRAFYRGRIVEGFVRTAALWADCPIALFSRYKASGASKIFQHSASPEVALNFEIVQFLLQSLDLRRVHGIPLFDQVFDFVQIPLGQR
ncbi:MAG: M48 family metalloprotease [Candidatus Riflebacteria bacterium]|nr:M48 family metalloprotease [Candidatus Riflebacteria bacterium]